MEGQRLKSTKSADTTRSNNTWSGFGASQPTKCMILVKPFLLWKSALLIAISVIFIVDQTLGNSTYSCQHAVFEKKTNSASTLQTVCVQNFLPVGLTIAILILQFVASIPKLTFALAAICRVLQIACILFVKYTIQKQIYYNLTPENPSPAYYGFAMVCGLVLSDAILDNHGSSVMQRKVTIATITIIVFALMLTEILLNKYQTSMLLIELVVVFGPVGLTLLAYNCVLMNCFNTVLKHKLDPRYISHVIVAGPLTYVLISVTKVSITGVELVILFCGVITYMSVWTAWCFTKPTATSTTLTRSHSTIKSAQLVRLKARDPRQDELL